MLIKIKQFTIQNKQLQKLPCPVTKSFCLAVCTVKSGLVFEWVTRVNQHLLICFRINNYSKFGAATVIQVFPPFYALTFQEAYFFLFVLQRICYLLSRKNVGKLNVIQTSTVSHNSVQTFRAPKYLLCGFVLLCRTIRVSLTFLIKKFS